MLLLIYTTRHSRSVCTVLCGILLLLLYFYRKPAIRITPDDTYLLSPAFGTVSRILSKPDGIISVSIFLSPLDIHSQYYPCDGTVVSHLYDNTGKFAIASDAYKSDANEKMITHMRNATGDLITITQIAGILVRQISTPSRTNEAVSQGEFLGMIKFGSRVDIEFSENAYRLLETIRVGKVLRGPYDRIAVRSDRL